MSRFLLCKILNFFLKLICVAALISLPLTSYTEENSAVSNRSYMEAGVAFVMQGAADYRGSNHYRPNALPLPYFLYQGPILKADKDGVRGDFWSNHRMEFNLSADGSLNGNSDNNKAREGMPELDSAAELGPSLNIRLLGESISDGLSLRLPVRAVITVSSSGVDHIGNVFTPRLNWRLPDLIGNWRGSLSAGLMFADRDYHGYFYGVSEQYVTDSRSYYEASGGYSGSFLRFTLYKPWESWRVGISVRYDYLDGSSFEKSPLVNSLHYGSISVGVVKRLWVRK
jgi:outer membrane protein